jgi:zinc resistance-associated protein
MLGPWGGSPDYGRGYYGNLTSEQQSSLAALERKFHAETGDLRDQIRTKSRELDLALAGSDPNLEEVQALQQELSDLRARLDEKTLAYELEAGRIVPGQRSGYGYGRGYGHHSMAPYGHGMGYGAGYCWN